MQIGLIGGIGPAATDFYYRRLIDKFAVEKQPLELTIAHADAPTLLENLGRDDRLAQAEIFTRLTRRLASAGANCVAVTSIAGHFCRDAFKASSPIQVIDMIAEVSRAVRYGGFTRIGILGTRTVMETRFYGAISSATIIPPSGQDLMDVHQAYVTMAASGVVTEAQREVFDRACQRLIHEQGAQAIMLGGTDLALAYNEQTSELPVVHCASIHVDAIVRFALEQ